MEITTRSIGGLTADVTISEDAIDELEITQHPVEAGSTISDHAIILPKRVTVNAGFKADNASDAHEQLLATMAKRAPITIQTGKRTYKNMLIKQLEVTTDKHSEYVLLVTISLQEIILATTRRVTLAPSDVRRFPSRTRPKPTSDNRIKRPVERPAVNAKGTAALSAQGGTTTTPTGVPRGTGARARVHGSLLKAIMGN